MESMEVLDLAIPEKRFSKEQLTATKRINLEFYYVCLFIVPESESFKRKPKELLTQIFDLPGRVIKTHGDPYFFIL